MGNNTKARVACEQKTADFIWSAAEHSLIHLEEWRSKAAKGAGWLKAVEEGRGWMTLVLRAWREETEAHGGRNGAAMGAGACRVRWPAHLRPRGVM